MLRLLGAIVSWIRGVDPIEEETERLIDLRGTMSASEWLDLAEPHYEMLVSRLRLKEGN